MLIGVADGKSLSALLCVMSTAFPGGHEEGSCSLYAKGAIACCIPLTVEIHPRSYQQLPVAYRRRLGNGHPERRRVRASMPILTSPSLPLPASPPRSSRPSCPLRVHHPSTRPGYFSALRYAPRRRTGRGRPKRTRPPSQSPACDSAIARSIMPTSMAVHARFAATACCAAPGLRHHPCGSHSDDPFVRSECHGLARRVD